jgi:SAM-dependent methyltransferase
MNPSRVWLDREIAAFADRLPAGSLVLDAGAGNQIYRPRFAAHRYEAADFEKVDKAYAPSTYVCDLSAIPVEDGRFDAVVFSQVMEHLPEPSAVLAELRRVLKPGGLLFYSAPLLYEEHEVPYDFYRYTQFGVRHLMGRAGFEIQEFRWLEGYMGTLHYLLRRTSRHLPLSPSKIGGGPKAVALVALFLVLKPLLKAAGSLAGRVDVKARYTETGYPINYVAVARRPA